MAAEISLVSIEGKEQKVKIEFKDKHTGRQINT
jgi:hypothetical protein